MAIKNIEMPCTNYTFMLTPVDINAYKVIARSTRFTSFGRAKKDLGVFRPTEQTLEQQLIEFKSKFGIKHKTKAIVIYEVGTDDENRQ